MADINSNLPVQDTADGTDGAAAPSTVQQVGGIDGSSNLQSISVDSSGKININSTAQPGVDIGDVTINNASGGSAVNIQDGGNSLTVDGTVAATQSGTWNVTNISGTVSLPTGASTESTLSTLNGKIPSNLTVTSTRLLVDASGTTITASTKTPLTSSSPTASSVGTSSAQAVASNSSRKGLILVNTSNNTISIGLGATAVLNSGITLYPGGTFQMDEYCFTTGAINAIANVTSSNLAIQEYT